MTRNGWQLIIGLGVICGLIGCDSVPPPTPTRQETPTTTGATITAVSQTSTPSATPSLPDLIFHEGFGIDYCGDDLSACANLGATWSRHTGITTVTQATAALDEASTLNMQLILRMNQGDWGWNGRQFDLSILETMRPIFEHPALIGFYGLHEPLERFTLDELRLFYQQYQEMVADPSVLLWHDVMRIPDGFTDGICDLCGVATNPHVNDPDNGNPINDWSRTNPRLETALRNMIGTSRSTVCVLVQVYGGDGRNFLRMPQHWLPRRLTKVPMLWGSISTPRKNNRQNWH
ncbi:MAG: hypothetical protein GY805_35255 [Chloroflexi bacterium]|nr:hypothetical protein [Chloroflexota bacterium]